MREGHAGKTWRRNGAELHVELKPDGWWQATVYERTGEVRDSAICQNAFALLRAMARGFQRAAVAAAVAMVLGCVGSGRDGVGGSGEPRCGRERWAVKTATDGVTLRQDRPLKRVTVAQLSALQAPKWHEAMPRDAVESEVVEAVVFFRASKFEDEDGDYHLIISDTPDGPTMIAEAPDPDCAQGSPYADRMAEVRRRAVALIGLPGPRLRPVEPPKRVRLIGVPFWDKKHGQSGMAPNGIELHPLLGVAAADL